MRLKTLGNLDAYYYLARMRILVSLAYRFEVFATVGTNLMLMKASIFLWKAAYRGIDSVAGVNAPPPPEGQAFFLLMEAAAKACQKRCQKRQSWYEGERTK